MTLLATLILTGIDLAEELKNRKANEPPKPTSRTMMAEATLQDFRNALASAIREGREVTPEEIKFWLDRINQDRAVLRNITARGKSEDMDGT